MSAPATPARPARWPVWVVALVAAAVATNYTLNHFYADGGYLYDSGWFAHMASTPGWPPPNPPIVGGHYFTIHLAPLFVLWAAGWAALEAVGLSLWPAAWWALIMGSLYGLLAAALYALVRRVPTSRAGNLADIGLALACTFSGIGLAVLGFVHYEIAIPAALLGFFALWSRGRRRWALVVLAAGVLVREDAALHYALLFALIAIWQRRARATPRAPTLPAAWLTAACAVAGIAALVVQALAYPSRSPGALTRVYLGDPVWGHVTPGLLVERLGFWLLYRGYIWVPLAVIVVIALRRRSLLWAIGPLSALPWLMLSLPAVSDDAGELVSYYAFPLFVATMWPLIAARIQPGEEMRGARGVVWVLAVISIVVVPLGRHNHDRVPFDAMVVPMWVSTAAQAERQADAVLERPVVVDNAVAALAADRVTGAQWRERMAFRDDELRAAEALVYRPGTWLDFLTQPVRERGGWVHRCPLGDSGFIEARRTPCPAPPR